MADAVASHQQQAVILRREKKVAYDMMFVITALVICSVPSVVLKTFQSSLIEEYRYFYPWVLSCALLKASVNPIIHFWRNKELRNAIKSLLSC